MSYEQLNFSGFDVLLALIVEVVWSKIFCLKIKTSSDTVTLEEVSAVEKLTSYL